MTERKNNFIWHFFSTSIPIFFSRVLGLVRDLLFAKYLGASVIADVVLASFMIPNSLRRAFGEGAVSNSFIPIFSEKLKEGDTKEAENFASKAYSTLLWFIIILTILFEIFMPAVIHVMLPGFTKDPKIFQLSINMCRIVFPFLIFICLYSFFTSVLQVMKKFSLAISLSMILNIVLIVLAATLNKSIYLGYYLAIGFLFSGISMFLISKIYSDKQYKKIPILSPIKTVRTLKEKDVKIYLKNIVPGLLSSIMILSTSLFATFYSGAVSWLYYANRLTQFPFGIIAIPLSLVLLPYSSKAKTKEEKFSYQSKAIVMNSMFILPCTAGFIAFGQFIVSLIFERGVFTPADTMQTYYAIIAFTIGIPFLAYIKIVSTAFYSNKDTKTPFKYTLFTFTIGMLMILLLRHIVGFLIIPIEGTITNILLFILLYKRASKDGLMKISTRAWIDSFKIFICSIIMGISVYILGIKFLTNWATMNLWSRLFSSCGIMGTGAVIYFILIALMLKYNVKKIIKKI